MRLALALVALLLLAGVAVAQSDCGWNWACGDLDCDGDVDILDFSILSSNYGKPQSEWQNPHVTPTPQPLGRKGLAATGCAPDEQDPSPCAAVDYAALLDSLNIDVLANWGCGGNWAAMQAAGVEYVPMQWKDPIDEAKIAAAVQFWGPGLYWLIFNEPNLYGNADSAGITPEQAVPLFIEGTDRILAHDPAARIIAGGVMHRVDDQHIQWLTEFYARLPQEYRDRIYGWHGHHYVFSCSTQPDVKACWQDSIREFVGWCRAHGGRECWDTEGPALWKHSNFYRAFLLGEQVDADGFHDCQGMTCYEWWRRQFDVTLWWSQYARRTFTGATVAHDGTLTDIGQWFSEAE